MGMEFAFRLAASITRRKRAHALLLRWRIIIQTALSVIRYAIASKKRNDYINSF